MYRDYAVTPQSSDSSLADSLQTLRVSPDPNSEEDDAPIQTLPSLSEEDRLRVQGSSPSEIREWALSEASLFPFGLYAYRLRALSNSTLPVNRLPPEILFKIFEFFRQDSLCSGSRWVAKVMGVCRYWREILVSSPLAWSIIDLRDTIHFIQLCLSRSEDVDLHVAFYHPVSESCLFAIDAPSIPNEFAQHLHRISRLELSSDSLLGLNRTSLLSMLDSPMPRLTELSIRCEANDGIPLRLNSTHFPRLQRLSLHRLSMAWDPLVLPQLTTLTLTRLSRGKQPTLDTLIQFLEAAPSLRELTLRKSGPMLTQSVPPLPSRPVILSSVRTLIFRGETSQCRALLSRLSFPGATRIWLAIDASPMTSSVPSVPVDPKETFKDIKDITELVGSLPAMRTVSIQMRQRYFSLGADPSRVGFSKEYPLLHVEFKKLCCATGTRSNGLFQIFLSEMPGMLPRSLTSLSLDDDSTSVVEVDSEHWKQVLVSFPRLRVLCVISTPSILGPLFQALRPTDGLLPCPKLQCFIVGSARLSEVDDELDQLLGALYKCLKARSRAGARRLQELQLRFPRATQSESAATREGYTRRFRALVDVLRDVESGTTR